MIYLSRIQIITANNCGNHQDHNWESDEDAEDAAAAVWKLVNTAVAIVTSGSADDNMIAQIFNEFFAIWAKRKHEITVIECDAKVQRV